MIFLGKVHIIAEYPGAEKGTRFTIHNLDRIVRSYRDSDISMEVELMQYARQFQAVAFWLVDNNKLTICEHDRYFWYGLPQAARTAIDWRLEVRDPAYSRHEAPDFHKAIKAGRFVFSDEALDVNQMGNHLLNHPNTVRQPLPTTLPISRPHAVHQPLDFEGTHDRYGRDALREVETRTVPFAPPAPTTQKPTTDDIEELVRKMYSLDVADVSYMCCYTRLIGLMPAAAQVWTSPLWDVHHPWAGKPLFSSHMRTSPMCSLCIPAFPEFRSMRPSAGDPEVDRGNSGIIGPLSDIICIHSAPPMSFPEVYQCVFALSYLLFTCLDISIPLVFHFGTELLRIVIFFFHFP